MRGPCGQRKCGALTGAIGDSVMGAAPHCASSDGCARACRCFCLLVRCSHIVAMLLFVVRCACPVLSLGGTWSLWAAVLGTHTGPSQPLQHCNAAFE